MYVLRQSCDQLCIYSDTCPRTISGQQVLGTYKIRRKHPKHLRGFVPTTTTSTFPFKLFCALSVSHSLGRSANTAIFHSVCALQHRTALGYVAKVRKNRVLNSNKSVRNCKCKKLHVSYTWWANRIKRFSDDNAIINRACSCAWNFNSL